MTVSELKKYVYEQKKIETVLTQLGCHQIHYHPHRDTYSAAFPDGDNPQGINIKNSPYLNFRSFSRDVDYDDGKDIIDLVEKIKQCSFSEAIKVIHKILDLPYKKELKKSQQNQDLVKTEKNRLSKFKGRKHINVDDIHALPEAMLDDYTPLLYIGWLREGIMPWTARKFGIAFSYRRKRIIIPLRHWQTGELLGINARTIVENYDLLGIKKYFITPTYQKNLNLFGLYENQEAIQKAGYVVIYEAEKSVLKRDSLNDSTGVALSGHTISDEQVSILLGLNVDIVLALDKDISNNEVRFLCEKFYGKRNVYYLFDRWGLLGEKDSPADASNQVFQFLMKYKVKYDVEEHRKYLKSLKNKS